MKRILACMAGVLVFCAVSVLNSAIAQEEPKAKDEPAKSEAATEPPKTDPAPAGGDKKPETGHAKGEDHGHAHDHDPLDKTHANASPSLHAAEEFRFDQAVATFIIFLLLAAILAKFAWGPITDGLDKRESGIAKMIDDARLAQEQAEAQLRSYEAKLAAAAEEARAMVAQARADADATRERELALTKAEAEKQLQRAKDDIEAAKNTALQQIAEKSVNTAISLASNIVRREVRPEDHDQLVTDALSKFSKLN